MAKYVVIGSGLIATALKKKIGNYGWYPEEDTEVIFYMNGPTHMDFEKNPDYHRPAITVEFGYLLDYANKHGIRVVYPSSALIYEKNTEFVRHKLDMEFLGSSFKNNVGLRIFPVYGPGETKTVISKWCREMKFGKQPQVFGDGTQKRDFIFIDDAVDQILYYAEQEPGIYDVGIGHPVSFNEIVEAINKVLGTDIKPQYVMAPPGYSEGISCKKEVSNYTNYIEGIKKICEAL